MYKFGRYENEYLILEICNEELHVTWKDYKYNPSSRVQTIKDALDEWKYVSRNIGNINESTTRNTDQAQ